MPTLFYIIIGALVLCIYMLIRNQWVYKHRIKWNDSVYNYRGCLISGKDNEALDKYSYSELMESISSYNKMFLMFWEWRLSRFIEDQNKFNLVIEGSRKGGINYVC